MEITQCGIKIRFRKFLKMILIISICLFIIFLHNNFKKPEINTLSDLSDLLRIDLTNDIYYLYDIEYSYYQGETTLNLYYSITDVTLNNKEYYQFRTDYNPMPSLTSISLTNEKFLKKNNVTESEISYMNTRFSEYKIDNLFGKLSAQIDVHIHIIKPQNNHENCKIILSTSIPGLKINISQRDLLFSKYESKNL